MSSMAIFIWGVTGSLAVEIVRFVSYSERAPSRLPLRYSSWRFCIARGLLALVGGGVALAYQIQNPLLALHIGAATPLIVMNFSRGSSSDQWANTDGDNE